MRKLLRAMAAVGHSMQDRGRWLVGFVNHDLAHASPATLDRLRWELLGFAAQGDVDVAFPSGAVSSPEDAALAPDGDPGPMVQSLHSLLRTTLTLLLREPGVLDTEQRLPFTVTHHLTREADGRIVRRISGAPGEVLLNALSDLLVAVGPRLGRCDAPQPRGSKPCGRFFVRLRYQRECSAVCNQRRRSREWRDRERERRVRP